MQLPTLNCFEKRAHINHQLYEVRLVKLEIEQKKLFFVTFLKYGMPN